MNHSAQDGSSRDPAVLSPASGQLVSAPVRLDRGDGGVCYRSAERDGVLAAAVDSDIDILDRFSVAADHVYIAVIERASAGSMLDGRCLPQHGVVALAGGRQHLARTVPGSRWVETTLPLVLLEQNQVDVDALQRRLLAGRVGRAGSGVVSPSSQVGVGAEALRRLLRGGFGAGATGSPLHGHNGVLPTVLTAVDVLGEIGVEDSAAIGGDRGPSRSHGLYRALGRALDFIEARYAHDIGLVDIAAAAACSPRQLQQAFRVVLDTSPLRFLQGRRLARARELLMRPGANLRSVGEVAMLAGFRHRGRFSSAYRRQFGELPAATVTVSRPGAP